MFNIDTAYDSDDYKEEYYVNGQKITKGQIGMDLSKSDSAYYGMSNAVDKSTLDNGISIINVSEALPFSQNLSARDADYVIIGLYNDSLFNQSNLEKNSHSGNVSFEYGIKPTTSDPNLGSVSITPKNNAVALHDQMRLIR